MKSTTVDPKKLETIKKLLALAEDERGNEHLAAAAAAKLNEFLLREGLDLEQVRKATPNANGTAVLHDTIDMGIEARGAFQWCLLLAGIVSHVTMTSYVYTLRSRSLSFIGRPTNVESAKRLYVFLRDQIVWLAHQSYYHIPLGTTGETTKTISFKCGSFEVPLDFNLLANERKYRSGESRTKFYNNFQLGCAHRVFQRIWEEMKKTQQQFDPNQVTALVSTHTAENQHYMTREFTLSHKKTKSNVTHDEEAYTQGHLAGDLVKLSEQPELGG